MLAENTMRAIVGVAVVMYGGYTLRFSHGPYEYNILKFARARAKNG
jgi:hypothetical protein